MTSSGNYDALVSVIIVNWNARDQLRECLQSIRVSSYSKIEVLVLDNGSIDGSLEMLRADYPLVEIIENHQNLSFAEASNAGILSARGEFLFLVNNDARVDPECIKTLVKVAHSDQRIGVLGCKVYLARSGVKVLEHAGGVIYPSGYTTNFGYLETDSGQYDRLRDVDYVVGAALMVTRSTIKSVGLLDPIFGLYYEETDLCYRARKAGFRVVYVPDAVVHHLQAMTIDKLYSNQEKRNRMERSRVTFVLKNFDRQRIGRWVTHELGMLVSIMLRLSTPDARNHLSALIRSYCWNLNHLAPIIRRRIRSH